MMHLDPLQLLPSNHVTNCQSEISHYLKNVGFAKYGFPSILCRRFFTWSHYLLGAHSSYCSIVKWLDQIYQICICTPLAIIIDKACKTCAYLPKTSRQRSTFPRQRLGYNLNKMRIITFERINNGLNFGNACNIRKSSGFEMYSISDDLSGLVGIDLIMISVCTPLRAENGRLDMTYIYSTLGNVAVLVRNNPKSTVVIRSTVTPGTVLEYKQALERSWIMDSRPTWPFSQSFSEPGQPWTTQCTPGM
ncbi:hypothetical protein QTG54_006394 [Skeletonema marinoi]|uniref:UDP-glucose/GDP-mannose dehydrogenase N-terminal domain-containing protein n=1 Tax=Skeletonema marinoi TaxID=267567 RepID=A0AAD9DD03_9STRA|nr:hypothetical protein QTG54_006394 [Skeletonema marinoi]